MIEGNRRFRPGEEGGDGRLDGIGPAKDLDAFLMFGEAISILAHRASFLGCRLFVVSLLCSVGLSEETFEELAVLVEVFDGVGVVGARAIHEFLEVVQ